MYLCKSHKFSCPACISKLTDSPGRMITDTSWMDVVFNVKFSYMCVCVFVHICICICKSWKQAVPLVQSRQDDYRHKLDGSRPIMDVPQTWPILPNPTTSLGCSVLWTSENRPRSRPIMDVPPTRPLLLQHPTWLQLLTLKWKWQDFIPTHYFANFPQHSVQHCPLLTQEEIGQIYRFQII